MKYLFLSLVFLIFYPKIGQQSIEGQWERINKSNEKVTIYFNEDHSYRMTIDGRDLVEIERIKGEDFPSSYSYKLNSDVIPTRIDIISNDTKNITKGILEISHEGVMQMQINSSPGGEYPQKFDSSSPDYYKFHKSVNSETIIKRNPAL